VGSSLGGRQTATDPVSVPRNTEAAISQIELSPERTLFTQKTEDIALKIWWEFQEDQKHARRAKSGRSLSVPYLTPPP